MNKYLLIVPVGKDMEALFIGLKEFQVERVLLLSAKTNLGVAEKTKEDLDKFKIPVNINKIEGNIFEETFREVSQIRKYEKELEIIINVATGDDDMRCAATSAAFVNGLKAFSVHYGKTVMLPILKFSYYKILTDKKMDVLKLLFDAPNQEMSLDEISKATKMSLPLISYHINGNLKSEGLKKLGLVNSRDERGRSYIQLSVLGKLLVKGYVD